MQINLLEIDYLQLCFSDLDEKYFLPLVNKTEDLLLYQEDINVDKLRYDFKNPNSDYCEWNSFKIKVIDKELEQKINEICQQLNFTMVPKIKILVKLKPLKAAIIKCWANISMLENKYEINVMRK